MLKYQVFISSTYEDLVEERQTATWAIMKLGHIPSGMEAFTAKNDRGWETIQRTIDDSDYYVLIVAGRYGAVEPQWGMSWTEHEYEYAVSKGLPVLAFIRDDSTVTRDKQDRNPQQQRRLQKFVEKIRSSHLCRPWFTGKDLAVEINSALHAQMAEDQSAGRLRKGWNRGSGTRAVSIDPITGIAEIADEWHTLRDSAAVHSLVGSCEKGGALYLICINPQAFMAWRQHIEAALCAGVKLQLAYVDIEHATSAGKSAEWYAASMCAYGEKNAFASTQANLIELSTSIDKARRITGADPDVSIYRSSFPHPFLGALYLSSESSEKRSGWGLASPYLMFTHPAQSHNFGVLFSEPGTVYQRYLNSFCRYFEFLEKNVIKDAP
jgi:hypothetical protein